MFTKDSAFRIGSGRYLQARGALRDTAREVLLLGKKPFVLSGRTAFSVAGEGIRESLSAADIPFCTEIYGGACCIEAAQELAQKAKAEGCDVIVGVGGGVMMDLAKLVARYADCPILNIPTSTATCAAYTPLSVCYTKDFRTVGTAHHKKEVDCVIADPDILIRQPPRLFLAGVFDAMAKHAEIRHWYKKGNEGVALGLDCACLLAEHSFRALSETTAACLAAIERGEVTEAFERAVFALIAVTGVISGIARGSAQTALAHKLYETARALYPEQTRGALHGELVGIGMLWQNSYNGESEKNEALLSFMHAYGLPDNPRAAGIPSGEESLAAFSERIINHPKMKDADKPRLHTTLEKLWRI